MEKKYYYYDLHCHTTDSADAPMTVKKLIKTAKERGIDGVAITNHNKVYLGKENIDGVEIIPGSEISVNNGDHLLAYFVNKKIEERLGFLKSVEEVHKQGGFAVWAHPTRENGVFNKGFEEVFSVLDGLEINGMDSKEENQLVFDASKEYNLLKTAGSDAHTEGQLGVAVLKVKEKINKENFLEVIKNGEVIVREEFSNFKKKDHETRRKISKIQKHIPFRKNNFVKIIFAKLVLRNWLRMVNIKLKKIKIKHQQD